MLQAGSGSGGVGREKEAEKEGLWGPRQDFACPPPNSAGVLGRLVWQRSPRLLRDTAPGCGQNAHWESRQELALATRRGRKVDW